MTIDRAFDDYGGASGPERRGVRLLFGDVGALPFGTPGRYGRAVALDNESGRAHERMLLGETRPVLPRLERVAARLPAGAAREGTRRRMRSRLPHLIRGRDREPIYQSILGLDVSSNRGAVLLMTRPHAATS